MLGLQACTVMNDFFFNVGPRDLNSGLLALQQQALLPTESFPRPLTPSTLSLRPTSDLRIYCC